MRKETESPINSRNIQREGTIWSRLILLRQGEELIVKIVDKTAPADAIGALKAILSEQLDLRLNPLILVRDHDHWISLL